MTAYSLHPGSVRTELLRYTGEGIFFLVPYLVWLVYPMFCVFSKSSAEGAQTTIEVSVSEEVLKYSGCYFRFVAKF